MSDNWRPGPEIERAASYEIAFCDDPNCGLHVVAKRRDGTEICEIVMSADGTLRLVNLCKAELYAKTVERDKE